MKRTLNQIREELKVRKTDTDLYLDKLTVTTVAGEKFTGGESCVLAFLIFKRFGRDVALAATKWREMHQNSTEDHQFAELVEAGEKLYNTLVGR